MARLSLQTLTACLTLFAGIAEAQSFDYYLLSLSWSPQYCASEGDNASPQQCGPPRRYGFVVHGLWPQYERGGYPANCERSDSVPRSIIDRMLPIMPSAALINLQWRKHGTCSGLGVDKYFADTRAAFKKIRIPTILQSPETAVTLPADDLEALFARDNPELADARMAVTCTRQYVSEIRICLDRDLKPRDCGRDIRDTCGKNPVTLRPVK